MGRLTDALKKTRASTLTSEAAPESSAIRFFDSKHAPASVSWNIGTARDTRSPAAGVNAPTRVANVTQPPREAGREHVWPKDEGAEKLVVSASVMPAAREWYRQLAASLHQAQLQHGIGSVVVTSAVAGEGKTLTAANLALTLSESYQRRVLLIDADLRRPSLHTLLGLPNSVGLREALAGDQPPPLSRVSARLSVLVAGSVDDDPMKILASERMRGLIREARARFDWVLLDTPPVGRLPDAKVLVSTADVVLLVVKAGKTPYDVAQTAVDAVGKERIFGVVLNGTAELDTAVLYGLYEIATRPR